MSLAVYMDVHVPAAVTEGLRRKLLDVRTAQADAAGQLSDEELLARATAVGCVLLTQDADFLEITAPDTTLGRDLLTLVRRGDVVGASFACSISQSAQKFVTDSRGRMTRVIQSISTLHEVSIVTEPAYP